MPQGGAVKGRQGRTNNDWAKEENKQSDSAPSFFSSLLICVRHVYVYVYVYAYVFVNVYVHVV